MKIIIDINHPGHVHLFKNLYWKLKQNNHNVTVVASKKEVSYQLLDRLNIPYIKIGTYGTSFLSKLIKLIWLDIKMFFIVAKIQPDVIIGLSTIRGAHSGIFFKNTKVLALTDTEHAKEQIVLYKNIVNKIISPDCFFDDFGQKHLKYKGYHELAYLHPEIFTPNKEALENLGIDFSKRIFLLRFVSWDATHDKGETGFSFRTKKELIKMLSKIGTVYISSEAQLPIEFEQYKLSKEVAERYMHDLMAYCEIYIGEGATMAAEAAVLGTPSIYVNSLNMGYIDELEKKYKLLIKALSHEEIIKSTKTLLNNKNLKNEWKIKQEAMLKDKINVTNFLYKIVTSNNE
jgi:predicted glycosyltransferase